MSAVHVILYDYDASCCSAACERMVSAGLCGEDSLTVLDTAVGCGLGEAINSVVHESSCDIIMFVSAKVLPAAGFLEHARRRLENGAALVAGALVVYGGYSERMGDVIGISLHDFVARTEQGHELWNDHEDIFFKRTLPVLPESDELPDYPFDLSVLCALKRKDFLDCDGFDTVFASASLLFIDLCRRLKPYGSFNAFNEAVSYYDERWNQFTVDTANDRLAFLRKYPTFETELLMGPDWYDYVSFSAAIEKLCCSMAGVACEDTVPGDGQLYISLASQEHPHGCCRANEGGGIVVTQELLGLCLPYAPGTFRSAVFSPRWALLPEKLLAMMLQEALRVADDVMLERAASDIYPMEYGGAFDLYTPFVGNRYIAQHIGVFDFFEKDDRFIHVRWARDAYISIGRRVDTI